MKNKQTKSTGGLMLWIAVLIGIIGVIFAVTKIASQSAKKELSSKNVAISLTASDDEWSKWNTQSKIVLTEYADFQCPACGAYYPIVKKLEEDFGNDIKFVFRHFPLKQIHKNANIAAVSAESAGRQNKFWEMHDLIFENQDVWSSQGSTEVRETFVGYAEKIDINIEQFKKDIRSKEIQRIVDESYASALKSRINSTPTFFLNGEKILTPRSYEDFRDLLKQSVEISTDENTANTISSTQTTNP